MPITETLSSLEYDFITPQHDDQCARIRFTGSFQGNPVIWHAQIMTLQYWCEHASPGTTANECRQFIDIRPGNTPGQFALDVALGTCRIDHPTILKTIIMIRNYKRLATGRHEFGGKPMPLDQESAFPRKN